ncbi:two-component system response regulator YesN [Natronobacillus azotifigens]|uniref:Response regulator n=1 Tax=Natronobacillus azotifigens TaxID=472978 RepID=A0A9J6RBT9_9BACI|nr:response regulator [Natronobacillus azotifigens]MCZ0703162.1 response regulator [Natronobacillus azotifigens]
MIKLMIVDDEEVERFSMEQILTQGFQDINILQASNGISAIELAKKEAPDVILMDIKMPEMNGMDAIKAIKAIQPTVKFIMVTAYDTFSYAKEAIKLGAKDYILKPSKISEILSTVGEVIELVENERKLLTIKEEQIRQFEQSKRVMERDLVTQLLFDHVHDVHVSMLLELLNLDAPEELFVFLVVLEEDASEHYQTIVEQVKAMDRVFIGSLYKKQLPVIVFRNDQSYRAQMMRIAKELKRLFESKLNVHAMIGVGGVFQQIDQTKQSYREALISAMRAQRNYQVLFHHDLPKSEQHCEKVFDDYISERFFDQVSLGKWEEIKEELTKVIDCYETELMPLNEVEKRLLQLFWVMGRTLEEMNVEIDWEKYSFSSDDYQTLVQEVQLYFDHLNREYKNYYRENEVDSMKKIKHYIMQHSDEDISLERLSEQVQLSPIYISKMFKERLGINYIDFLTECRINKAKQLLSETELSIKSIALETGYQDPNYFGKVFKKFTGLTPKKYREALIHKR